MAVRTNWYTMDNKVGVNLNRVITSVSITSNPSQPEYPGIPHNLGDRVQGNGGSEWVFVQASATISTFACIAIGVGHKAENVTIGHVTATAVGYMYGFAQFNTVAGASVGAAAGGVANTGDFFWALLKANDGIKVRMASASPSAGNSLLFVAASSNGTLLTAGSCGLGGAIAVAATNTNSAELQMYSYLLPILRVSALFSA